MRLGMSNSPQFTMSSPNTGSVFFNFAYTFVILWVIVAIVSASIIDNLGNLRDMRSQIATDLDEKCFICNINRQMFQDTNESGFEEVCICHRTSLTALSPVLHPPRVPPCACVCVCACCGEGKCTCALKLCAHVWCVSSGFVNPLASTAREQRAQHLGLPVVHDTPRGNG